MPYPYVLTLGPILKEKVWGGRRLERLGKALPSEARVGESWEVADLHATSTSGGGGEAARSVITNGPLAGRTLHDAMTLWGDALLGHAHPTPAGGFPLLVKFLDAQEHLSVQVHPSPGYARAHPEAHLKTECWYIVEAEPGSVIFKGVKPGVSREDFGAALRLGQGEGVVDLLASVPAVAGDCHNLPSGTVHALGAGVLVAEVQTPSDTTFRVYDWAKEYGRAGRELHVEQALDCIDFAPAESSVRAGPGVRRAELVRTEFYTVTVLSDGYEGHASAGCCAALVCLDGNARVGDSVALERGGVAVLPATSTEHVEVVGTALLLTVNG